MTTATTDTAEPATATPQRAGAAAATLAPDMAAGDAQSGKAPKIHIVRIAYRDDRATTPRHGQVAA